MRLGLRFYRRRVWTKLAARMELGHILLQVPYWLIAHHVYFCQHPAQFFHDIPLELPTMWVQTSHSIPLMNLIYKNAALFSIVTF